MNFNNIYRDYILHESDNAIPNQPSQTNGIMLNDIYSDPTNTVRTDVELTKSFVDRVAEDIVISGGENKYLSNDFISTLNRFDNDKDGEIGKSKGITNNKDIKSILTAAKELTLGKIKMLGYLISKVNEYQSKYRDYTHVVLYSNPNTLEPKKKVLIPTEALKHLCNWYLNNKVDVDKRNPNIENDYRNELRELLSLGLDENIYKGMLQNGPGIIHDLAIIFDRKSNIEANRLLISIYKQQQKENKEDTDESDRIGANLRKFYMQHTPNQDDIEYKKIQNVWQQAFDKATSGYIKNNNLIIPEDKAELVRDSIVNELISFINERKNKIILECLSINPAVDSELLANVINEVEYLRYSDNNYNNGQVKTDAEKVKELEDEFESIKNDYEKLMKSKEAKAVSHDNKAVHALLKTCGGLISGVAFILGGLTKFAGAIIPGATLITPYTAKIAKGLRTIGKMSYDAGTPLSAKSSKVLKKAFSTENKDKSKVE